MKNNIFKKTGESHSFTFLMNVNKFNLPTKTFANIPLNSIKFGIEDFIDSQKKHNFKFIFNQFSIDSKATNTHSLTFNFYNNSINYLDLENHVNNLLIFIGDEIKNYNIKKQSNDVAYDELRDKTNKFLTNYFLSINISNENNPIKKHKI